MRNKSERVKVGFHGATLAATTGLRKGPEPDSR